jgi:hemerythrin-like domain-containing protein
MKRHKSIVSLSREHHFGLLFCWKIRQGLNKKVPAERMQPYIKYFWGNHLLQHFEEEEKLLFVALQDSLVEQAISEHKNIRQLMEAVTGTKPVQPEQLSVLADTLENHIRFEDRVLFPHMEKELPESTLIALEQQLHPTEEKDAYPDEFWV